MLEVFYLLEIVLDLSIGNLFLAQTFPGRMFPVLDRRFSVAHSDNTRTKAEAFVNQIERWRVLLQHHFQAFQQLENFVFVSDCRC